MRGKGGKADGRNSGVTIIRKEEVGQAESHGGAWKVAYADFVTAMMAFFLLMWLLNATTEDQRKGLADYFSPTNLLSHASSGTGQPFGGHTAFDQGAMISDRGAVQVIVGERPVVEDPEDQDADTPLLANRHDGATAAGPDGQTGAATQGSGKAKPAASEAASGSGPSPMAASLKGTSPVVASARAANPAAANPAVANSGAGSPSAAHSETAKLTDDAKPVAGSVPAAARAEVQSGSRVPTEAEPRAEQQRREKQAFEQAAAQIRQAVRSDPALADLSHQLAIDITPEGLRVQLLDEERRPMFATGSATPNDRAKQLLAKVVPVLTRLPEDIAVVGHTDAAPYAGNGKTNWELSSERANATRRLLTDAGLVESRISRVTGLADRDPLVPADPLAAANRRIAIIVLRASDKPTEPAGLPAAPSAPQSIAPSVPSSAPPSTPMPTSATPSAPSAIPSSDGAAVSPAAAPSAASAAPLAGRSSAPSSAPSSAATPARSSVSPPIAAPVPSSAPPADAPTDPSSGPPPAPSFAPSFAPPFAPTFGPSGAAASPPVPP